jgi:hypothetical protein
MSTCSTLEYSRISGSMRSVPLKPDEIRQVPGCDNQFFSFVRWHPDFIKMGSEVIDDILVYLHRSAQVTESS